MPTIYRERRILIWGKTYPELSNKYFETVCTGGVLEDGSPVRLYPIPFRYLDEQFHKYQWVTMRIAQNENDYRPESYKVDRDSIRCGEVIPPGGDEWSRRADFVFKNPAWQFDSVDDLQEAQEKKHTSLGVVIPKKINGVEVVRRSREERLSFREKLAKLQAESEIASKQLDFFIEATPPEMKDLSFLSRRLRVDWECNSADCRGHTMQILDWEVAELHRRLGDDKALSKVRDICDLSKYALKFFLGNLYQHPTAFTIVGLWYPRRSYERRLFT
jgi:hypothetical protein